MSTVLMWIHTYVYMIPREKATSSGKLFRRTSGNRTMSEPNWQSLMDEGREAFAKNRTVQAEQFFLQALKQATEAGDAEDNVAATLNNLAAVYHTQGKYQWAEERYTTALSIQERLFGKNSAPVATTVFNLAVL